MEIVFAPAISTPDHIVLAEELGYERAWVYDVPTSYAHTGITVAAAAARTSTIRLGVAVFTPHLRHLTTNAAPDRAPGHDRVGALLRGVGAGFTSSTYLNRKPSKWATVEAYIVALRELLAGN
jgi:5,10-methylenetetrahydromethanopterin reductase